MIKLKKLNFNFPSFSTEFDVETFKNEIFGVIGKSGSGKSTLFNLISGFLKPHSGKIIFDNTDITNLEPNERNLSILFQDHNNFDHLTIFQNIILGIDPAMKKTDDHVNQVKKVLKKISLNFDIDTKVSNLSGGEQQRVSIARCLLRNKKLLLLDEPFNSLDPGLRKKLYKDILTMTKKEKICTLISSHLIDELKNITNNFFFIHKGKIIENRVMTYQELSGNKYFKDYLQ